MSGSKTTNSPVPQANGQQAAGNGAPVQVEFANGQNIARVPTAPGETITLPFDGDFQAKLGDQGNLAIKLGDRIVILQNYVETNQEAGVTIKDDKGHVIDVASVLASTDPNLDIQTAAGPAAGPAGGTGSGIFLSFNGGNGLGGLNELGTIGETELQYRTISPDENTLVRGDALVSLTVPVLGAAGTEVDEAGLPDGSNPKSHSNVTNGAITVSAPDGVASVTINGVVVTLSQLNHLSTDPVTIKTADGDLTLTGWNGSQLSYTYSLTHNTSGDHTSDSVSIVVTDSDGDQGSGTLVIGIKDDTPTAVSDTGEVEPGKYSTTGNVETNDIKGADGASVTHITSDYSHDSAVVSSDGTVTVKGEYGTLTIAADGSYTYTRNEGTPGGVSESFTYTLTDGDGDPSTATLTINIDDAKPTVTVGDGGVETVYEAGLPTGSDSAHIHESNVTKGSISYTEGDGPSTISINGVEVHAGDTITTKDGQLHIDSISNGTINYTYTLTGSTIGDNTTDTFTVEVKDVDNETADGTLTIHIVDDVPTAHNDALSIAAGDYKGHQANVITAEGEDSSAGADVKGADGATVSHITGANGDSDVASTGGTTIEGEYGILTIAADGSYTYTRNAGTPGGVDDVFSYTLKDGDGDTSTATLTVHIGDATPTVTIGNCGGNTVYEAGLPHGSASWSLSNYTAGSFTYTQGDGPSAITINGVAIAAGTQITGQDGTLTILSVNNGVVTYVYELTHSTQGDNTHDDFNVVVTDQDGDQANGNLSIHIVDDTPTARNDVDYVAAGSHSAETGNVITGAGTATWIFGADTKGADGASITHVTGYAGSSSDVAASGDTVVNGHYGVLTIHADGSYSYQRNDGTPGGVDDVFTYTLTDGDGDSSSATLTIKIQDAHPDVHVPTEGGSGAKVSEAGLANGSSHGDHSNITSGNITYSQGDGPATVTIGGVAVTGVGQTIYGQYGTLVITSVGNGVIGYSYTLTGNTSGDHTHDTFQVVVTDVDGDKSSANLTIDIVDDTPSAKNDSGEVHSGQYSAHGNVLTNDTLGADGASVSKVTGSGGSDSTFDNQGHLVVTGTYGTLTISADGSYTYTRNAGTPGGVTDTFGYTLKDGDGDTSTANLVINIDDAKPTLDLSHCGDASVSEAGLANGSHHGDHSNVTSGSITYTEGDGPATVTINGQAISAGMTIFTSDGNLHIDSINNGVINYTYTLTTNTSGDHTSDNFTVVVTDKDGDKTSGNLTISIVDDTPKAVSDSGEVNAGTYSAHGNVVANDTQGADGAHVSKVTGTGGADSTFDNQGHLVVTGTYGTLTIDADGNYTYSRNANTPGGVTDTFNYTLKDGDGDTSTANLVINIDDAKPTLDLSACGGASVHEAGLANGTHAGDHSNVTSGTFIYTEGDGASTVSINGQTIHAGDTITTSTGSLHIDTISNGTIGYTYTLAHNTSGDNTSDNFNVVVKDQDGDTASGTLTVGIVDDAPVAVNASATVDEDAIASGHQGSPGIEGGPGDLPGVVGNTAHIDLTGIKFGADGGQVSFDTSAQPGTLTSDGHTVQYRTETETVDGHSVQALIGYITYYSADNNSSTTVDVFKLTVDPTSQSADFTLLQPLDHPVKGTEDTLDLGLKYTVTDGDGDKATGTITVHVNDDSPTAGTVSSPTVTEPASSGSSTSYSYEVDAGNYHGNAHINVTAGFVDGNGNLMTINGDTPTINTNPAADGSTGLGVSSNTDGSGAARFDEINYLGNGSQHYYSEAMIVSLSDSHQVATSATVHLTEFYANEGGVGDEKGAYILYKDGVAVSGWIEFEASSTNGSMTLNITGPAGGFDEIRFIATQGSANPNGNSGSDSSDYSVHDVTFNGVTDGTTSHVNSVTGSLPVAFGADGPGSVILIDGPTGLTYNGVAIVNTLVNGIMVGKAGDTVVYTLTLSSDGHGNYSYEFDLAHQIDGTQSGHPLGFHYTVTDNDGDTATGTINVNVTDAAPVTPTALQSDIILTNSLDGSIHVSDFALLRNDTGSNLTVTGVSNADGTVSHDGTTGVTYQFSGGANDFTGSGKMDESKGNSDNWSDNPYSPTVISRGNFAQSSTLNTGTLQMTGALNSNSDVDAFKIHLQAGEVLYGSLFGTGNHAANVEVKIYDSTGHLVAQSGFQTSPHDWGHYNVPSDGDYYIVVDGQSGNGNNSAGGQGTYELDLNILSQAGTDGSFHYQAGGGDATVTVDGVSGGAGYGHDQHQVIGTNANEILVGDTHQHNYLNGGGGDDTIMYQVGDTVDGGGHSHNSDLGGSYLGDVLDVSELSGSVDLHNAISDGHIKNIDTVSMIGGSSQSVELNIHDVLQIGNGTFNPTSNEISGLQSKDTVKVEGGSGDSLTLDNGSGNGHWVNITDHLSNAPAGHQVYAYDGNGGAFNANDVQGYVIVNNNVTVHDEHNQVIPQL